MQQIARSATRQEIRSSLLLFHISCLCRVHSQLPLHFARRQTKKPVTRGPPWRSRIVRSTGRRIRWRYVAQIFRYREEELRRKGSAAVGDPRADAEVTALAVRLLFANLIRAGASASDSELRTPIARVSGLCNRCPIRVGLHLALSSRECQFTFRQP